MANNIIDTNSSGNLSLATPPATLYSAAAAASAATADQMPNNRPISSNTSSNIDSQAAQLQNLHRQQQQPTNQIYNGYKDEHDVPSLKAQAQQVLTPGGDHTSGGSGENNIILERLMGLKLGGVGGGNNISQTGVDSNNSTTSINANASQQQHGEHGLFAKTSQSNVSIK